MSERYLPHEKAQRPHPEINKRSVEFAQLIGGLMLGHIGMVESSLDSAESMLSVVFEDENAGYPVSATTRDSVKVLSFEEARQRKEEAKARSAVEVAHLAV